MTKNKFTLIIIFINSFLLSDYISNDGHLYDVEIHRDEWGVPHVFGKTDRDTAFGLAYAHAEDDFETIQDVLLALRGKLASDKGIKAAPVDYLTSLLDIWGTVNQKYETELSSETRLLCEGYADGLNRYVQKNPMRAAKGLFPVQGKDIVAGFVFRTPLMFGFDKYLSEILKKTEPDLKKLATNKQEFAMYGSNVIAVGPSRSSDGFTRIAINSHQPWEGPVAWYEAHIQSEQGLNISGGLFPGSPIVFKGFNDSIGWSHTVNKPDLIDVYKLKINPKNQNQYLLDGSWKDFEIKEVKIKVKVFGPIKWNVKRKVYRSVHGPVMKAKHGMYALRYAGHGLIGQIEQWYNMNKSNNLSEFKEALELMQIPMFNTVYADYEGNIYYLYNGLIPKRSTNHDWTDILPGDDSKLIWDEYYSYDELPQVVNPKTAYLQNCNSTPYRATVGNSNIIKTLPSTTGIETFQTNRAYRANELYGQNESISRQDFYNYKYDTKYSEKSVMKYALDRFLSEVQTDDELLSEGIEILRNWDLSNDKDSDGAALALQTFKITYDVNDFDYDYEILFDNFEESVRFFKKEFGKVNVSLRDFVHLKRGEVKLPVDGGPDLLRAIYSKPVKNQRVVTHGDCFFQMVEWDRNGKVSAESIHQYGSATLDKDSKHFSDQSFLFSDKEMKPAIIDKDEIISNSVRSYKP